jgi:NAD+ synthase (glutamine-hydrolysing)
MKLIKVGAAVLNQTPLDWDRNKQHILEAIETARAQDVSILCLPEMCIPGYGCEDAFHSPGLQATALAVLTEVAPATAGMIVCIGLPLYFDKALYNAAALVVDGAIVGFVAKKFLAGDGIHYEPRWFKAWPTGHQGEVDVAGTDVPVGDLYFDCGGVKIGFEICEDAWVANRPGSELALRGVDVILNPSASHFAFDKFAVRQRFCIEGSRAFGVTYVYSNLLGNESGRVVFDGGAIIATEGKLAGLGPRFSYRDVVVTTAVVDIEANRLDQARRGSHRPQHADRDAVCIEVDFSYPDREPEAANADVATWESSESLKEEEFSRVIALALFDYMRKSYSRGFVVSLSGGADSSATVCLVSLAMQFAVNELGFDAVAERLSYISGISEAKDAKGLVNRLLLTVYQATRNSGDVTTNAASSLAEALGAEHMELDVDALVVGYTDMIAKALDRELSWETDDVALQNIQARVRGPSVWFLANIRNALLLATSNRSEAAVGYATMDGDTCGGVSPIAGIDKAFLRQWLRWMESTGPDGAVTVPALSAVNVQAPTAELRPPDEGQTDEGDLMPYELLDAIEGAAIRDKHTPLEVYLEMRTMFEYSDRQLAAWIQKFFELWCRNQWKRERYAPSFHVDDENLDPKTWCRFPILSGGFKRELAQMRAYVEERAGK